MGTEPSTFENGVSKMELKSNHDVIIELKKAKEERHITLSELMDMLKANNQDVSKTTLTRVFREGSEDNDNFNYTYTLKPIADILLPEGEEKDSLFAMELHNLQAELKVKDETISKLREQIESLHNQMKAIREEDAKHIHFMETQIQLKDRRMDDKDVLIQRVMDRNDKKDRAIADLMEENKKLDESIRSLLEKCKNCFKGD